MKNKTEEKESRCDLSVVSVFIRKLSTFEGRELNCNSNSRYTTRNICKIYIIISLLYTYTYTLLYNISQPKVPMVIIYRNIVHHERPQPQLRVPFFTTTKLIDVFHRNKIHHHCLSPQLIYLLLFHRWNQIPFPAMLPLQVSMRFLDYLIVLPIIIME